MILFQSMLHILERVVLPCLQIALQLVFDPIEHRRPATVVVQGTESVKTLLLKHAQPIGDRIPTDIAQCGDSAVILSEVFQFDAEETTQNLGIALIFLSPVQFLLLSCGKIDAEGYGEGGGSNPIV